ncbi:MAG: hypothetical protein Q9209_005473 [Squamulea sp. 1 TL-2023]
MASMFHPRKKIVTVLTLTITGLWLLSYHGSLLNGTPKGFQLHKHLSRSSTQQASNGVQHSHDSHAHLHYRDQSFKRPIQNLDEHIVTSVDLHAHSGNITIDTHLNSFTKRDVDYDWYKCKGQKLLKMIQDDERPGLLPNDLSDWEISADNQDHIHGINGIIQPLLDQLGYAALKEGDAKVRVGVQNKEFRSGGKTYPATQAHYRNEYIIREDMHTIIATRMYSPRYKVGKDKPVPYLSRWSDWTWTNWEGICLVNNKAKSDLRYIIHDNIATPETKAIMHRIVNKPPEGPGQGPIALNFPGLLFGVDQDPGLALLGTVHGQGIAYLMRDHSSHMRTKNPTVRRLMPVMTGQRAQDIVLSLSPDQGKHEINHFVEQTASLYPIEEHTTSIPDPFGIEEYSHNFPTTTRQFPLTKRTIDFNRLVCTGESFLNMILRAQPKDQFKPEDLQNGWTRKYNLNPDPPE